MAADDPSATAAAKTVPDHAKQLAALDLPKDKWNGHGQDRGELVLLQWLTECEKAVNTLPQDILITRQSALSSTLLTLIVPPPLSNTSPPAPKPGRPARAILARIILAVYTRGESKELFDVVQQLLRGVTGNGETRGAMFDREKEWRVASCKVLGEVMGAKGQQVMSLFIDTVTTLTRVARTSSLPVILRCAALGALQKTINMGSQSMSDQLIRDTLKALRAGLAEKAGAIVRESANCLLALSAAPGTFATLADIDHVVQPALKAIEAADFTTRRAISGLVAGLLAHTQIEGSGAPPQVAPTKKASTSTGQPGDDDDDTYPSVGAPAASSDASTKTLLSPIEMLSQLSSPFNKFASSRRLRNGIIDIYAELLTALGPSWTEHAYADIVKHLIDEIGCGQAAGLGWIGWNIRAAERLEPSKARYDALAARRAVGILLRDVISGRLLSESGQIFALGEISQLYLRKWPNLLRTTAPPQSKQSLVIALEETSGLLASLGCAPQAVIDVLYDPLARLIGHPSHSVQVAAAWALRTLCEVAPAKLSSTIQHVVELLNKDLTLIQSGASSAAASPSTSNDPATVVKRRAIGHARALAALINLIPRKPLYVSFDLSAKCMSLAIQLLKQSGSHELTVSGVEIQLAWIVVSALMSLGPNFVRLHLPQLLILWRNALPKPTSKDASAAQVRGEHEWAFLLHIRECTLTAILSFLRHNSNTTVSTTTSSLSRSTGSATSTGLVTEDVGRRLVLLLSNGLAFVQSFATCHPTIHTEQYISSTSSRMTLADRDILLRRRLLECFVALGQNPVSLPYQVNLLTQATATISDPERYVGEAALQAAINSSSFTSVWDEVDGLAFGVTSLLDEKDTLVGGGNSATDRAAVSGRAQAAKLNRDVAEARIDEQLRASSLGAAEYDPLVLSSSSGDSTVPTAPPPAIGLVNAAIELFALYFPLQEVQNQVALLHNLLSSYRSSRLEKNPGRREAILANAITSIVGLLRLSRTHVEPQVSNIMREIIKEALLHSDAPLRQAAAEALGRLSGLGGTSFMAAQIQFCVSQVVNNTDPANRAGCALAFGQIYSHVGSLAAGPVLKTIVDVLLSLGADPHPLVHFNALSALSLVIDAASLSYAPFTNSTLGLLCKLYMQDTHEPEGGTPGSVNLRSDLPAYQAICRVADALIGVLGPELQESQRVRELVMTMLRELVNESDDGVQVEAIKATQHFLMFAPGALDQAGLVKTLRSQLQSDRQPLKIAAVNSVYQLVQRDAALMSKLGGDGLVQELFALLDDDPRIEGVRHAIISWLRQTADSNPSGWIDLCQRIMSRSTSTTVAAEAAAAPVNSGFIDEESQGLGLEKETGPRSGAGSSRPSSRWRTQLFALQCLHEIFLTVKKAGRREHFDIATARAVRASKRGLLITRVSDLIKMAFTASTAQVMEIRLEGLVVLRDVIENFGQSQDADFEDALLLEQFQAPIAAALTPAFASDSYPEVLASAIQVCAVFVGSGVVKEIEKMGRILKLLTTALEGCKESDMSSLGDVKDLSSTAAVMLKTSIFAAWAQFQTASVSQPYLVKVIEPHLPLLCPFWVATLREYARMRTDPDATSSDSGAGGAAFDSVYSGLSRETALPFYERSWAQILHAVGTLLKTDNVHMLRAVDGIDVADKTQTREDITKDSVTPRRDSPAQHFWILFGLSFEALCNGTASVQSLALEAFLGLIRAQVSGPALLDAALFDEVCNLCYRLAITEGPEIKARVMEIALQLARDLSIQGDDAASLTPEGTIQNPRMLQCLRVATCVLRETVPGSSTSHRPSVVNGPAYIVLIRSALSSFAELADLFPPSLCEQLYAIAFHFYAQLLRDETNSVDLVGPTLPIVKLLCDRATRQAQLVALPKVINGMLSACLQNIAGLKGRQGPAVGLKTRNNLLVVVLLLTSLPTRVQVGQDTIEHACSIVLDLALTTETEASATALQCLASLLAAASRGPGVLQFCALQLIPGIIEFVISIAAEPKRIDQRVAVVGETLKALVAVLSSVTPDRRTQAMSVLLPTLISLLSTESPPPQQPSPTHSLAVAHLLQLASTQPLNFKEATAALSDDQRRLLESSIRAQVGTGRGEASRSEAPKIALKIF